jgi:hypothetical protein
MLVARIPKSPLYTLRDLNLLYALLGIFLTLYILCFSKPSETRDIQARLTIESLAAACFEDAERTRGPVGKLEELFAERTKGRGFSQMVRMVEAEEEVYGTLVAEQKQSLGCSEQSWMLQFQMHDGRVLWIAATVG